MLGMHGDSPWKGDQSFGVVSPGVLQEKSARESSSFPCSETRTFVWIEVVPAIGREVLSNPVVKIVRRNMGFVPRTPLGRRLVALRNQAIQNGMRLLNEEEILREIQRRRGESADEEADLS